MFNHFTRALALIVMAAFPFFASASDNPALKVGDPIPAVVCPDHEGKPVDLAKVAAKGLTLVYFYPKADTPGCTKQGCSIRDSWGELEKRAVAVYGVSVDGPEAQKAFREKYRLPFPLLADKDKVVTKAFQTPSLAVAVGFAKRQAFLFENGRCIMADYNAPTTEQAEKVIKFLDARKP